MNKKYKGFSLEEMYMLHRAFIEASGEIMLSELYSDEEQKLYSDMLDDIEQEYKARLKEMEGETT